MAPLSYTCLKMQSRYTIVLLTTLMTILLVYKIYWISTVQSYDSSLLVPDAIWRPEYNSTMVRDSLKRMGFTLADLPRRKYLWTQNIQLCIMFNLNSVNLNEQVINFLISYYFPFFQKISLIFDGTPTYNLSWIPSFVKVIECDSHLGWFQHKCIKKCIQQNISNIEGYMYIADDMFINITKMAKLPRSKIWFLQNDRKSFSWIKNPGLKGWDWPWWGWDGNSVKFEKTIKSLPLKWITILKKYHGFPNNFNVTAISDIIFIPQIYVSKIIPVLNHIIREGNLFCEIATPLAVNLASQDVVKMEYGFLWADRSIAAVERISTKAHFVHPMKLGMVEYAGLWVRYMEQQLKFTVLRHNVKYNII